MNLSTEENSFFPSNRQTETAIVLLQMGGAYTLDDVAPFLFNLFSDPDLIRLPFLLRPFQNILAKLIVKARSDRVSKQYEDMGGGSPILTNTVNFAKELQKQVEKIQGSAHIAIIMRYSNPRGEKTIKELLEHKVKKIILYPLYPHYSDSIAESSLNDFHNTAKKLGYSASIIEIKDWSNEKFYLDWWITQIKQIYEKFKEHPGDFNENPLKVLFSAHGLPQSYIDKGDNYQNSVRGATEAVMKEIPDLEWTIAFQSRVGRQKWIKPYTTDEIKELSKSGIKSLIVVPIGFVSDHLETLQEIDILYRSEAKQSGINNFLRVPVPNNTPEFAKGAAQFLYQYLRE